MSSIQARLYTAQDLSERYAIMSQSGEGVTRQTIYRWRKNKGFPEPKVSSPNLLWLKAEVHAWENANGLEWIQDDSTSEQALQH